jgi:hypothetical protein
MTPQQPDTTWEKDASLVLHRLNTIDDELKEMNRRLSHLERSVWSLQAKAAVMGGIAGLLISGIGLLLRVSG